MASPAPKKRKLDQPPPQSRSSDDDDDSGDGEVSDPEDQTYTNEDAASNDGNNNEDDDDEAQFDDGYDSDLQGDEEDQLMLSNLPEFEREMILFDRRERRDRLLERKAAWQRMQGSKGKKRSSPSKPARADSRHLTTKEKALREMKQKREARDHKAREDSKRRKRQQHSDSEDEDGEHHDDRDYEEPMVRPSTPQARISDDEEEEPASQPVKYQEFKQIILKRTHLQKWLNRPFFHEVLPGFYIRSVGESDVYEPSEIVGTQTSSQPYQFGTKETNVTLTVRSAERERNLKMTFVSNSDLKQEEFERWEHLLDRQRRPRVTVANLKNKRADMKRAENYNYTNDEVQQMIEDKKRAGRIYNFASERAALVAQRTAADESGNRTEATRLRSLIDSLDQKASGSRFTGRLVGVNNINLRNKLANQSKKLAAQVETGEGRNEQGVLDPFFHKHLNPFNRRQTKSTMHLVFGSAKNKEDAQQKIATEDEEKTVAQLRADGLLQEQNQATNLGLVKAHDFEIDIDVDFTAASATPRGPRRTVSAAAATPPPPPPAAAPPSTPTLNLSDYFEHLNRLAM